MSMYYVDKCKRCGTENGYTNYNNLCKPCEKRSYTNNIILVSVFVLLGMIIGGTFGVVDYNYEINKCGSLSSSDSNYDFDHTIELNAEYNQGCFYLLNHPLALASYIFTGMFIVSLITGMIGLIIMIIKQMRDM